MAFSKAFLQKCIQLTISQLQESNALMTEEFQDIDTRELQLRECMFLLEIQMLSQVQNLLTL